VTATGPGSSREYIDDGLQLAVDLPGNGTIRLRVADDRVGATFDLSVLGGQRLSTMLGGAIATVIARGLPGGGDR
jgi:hypothetical protein